MKFSELSVGDQFKFKDIIYTKLEPQKISCCKVLNALNTTNNQKVMIKPLEDVEKLTSEQ